MKRGEIFGYAAYLVKTFAMPQSIRVIYADVMCKLWGYLKRVLPAIELTSKGALSVMHAKGHTLDCQVSDYDMFF